jgi:4'-phosphopantetheinyl transferase
MAARGWLRRLLASQLLCSPDEVRMVTGHGGKPRLARSHLRFNAARSGGVALYATSWRMEVGVDVEAIRATADVEGLAARFFSPTEQRGLASLPAAERLTASFHCWTRKEAYVKGIGAGLSIPLHTIDVWADSGQDVRVCGWTIHQVDVAFEFAAAVAGEELDGWVPKIPQELGSPNSNGLLGSLEP